MKESSFYQEIMAEGGLVAQRKAVIEVIEARFGAKAAVPFAESLQSIADSAQLSRLLRLAARCPRLKQLREAFNGHGAAANK
jgi:hypothetical protein